MGGGPRAMASQPPQRSLATADGNRAPSSKNDEKEYGDGMRRRTGANTKDEKKGEGEEEWKGGGGREGKIRGRRSKKRGRQSQPGAGGSKAREEGPRRDVMEG